MSKPAVIYYSATGHGTAMANRVAAAAEAAGTEAGVCHIAETRDPQSFAQNPAWTANHEATKDLPAASGEDIVWADAIVFGSPTRFGGQPSQFRAFIDTLGELWAQGKLADKIYAGLTWSQTAHGGQETTLMNLYTTLMHFGGIIVAPGYTDPAKFVDGNPYGVSHVSGPENKNPLDEATLNALDHLARRVVSLADRLGAGRRLSFQLGERVNGPAARPAGAPRSRRRCRSGFAVLGPAIDRCARRLQMGRGVGRGGREPLAAVVGGATEFPELPQVR